jgi:hypothetical protein
MQYVLGNMLNGAGGLNPDGLALDLQFAADKTLTARKGPTPVFTRGSTGTFVGSDGLIQSAAINTPRFDHTSAGVCRGLLIEEGRTNLLQRSEEFANAYWNVIRSTITTDAATSPDGATTAEKLIADTTAASNHRVDRATITLALNTVHTISIFAKAAEYTGLALGVGLSATEGVRFSLVGAGTATSVLAGNTGTIQQLSNGWYRCTCTFTSDALLAVHRVAITVGQNGTTTSYTGDGTSGILIWGAQLEAGSFATSYIPTVASSVVRSADVCSITGGDFTGFWNQTEGSLFASAIFNSPANYNAAQFFCDVNDNTSQNRVRFYRNLTTPTFEAANISSNTQDAIITSSAQYASNVTHKASLGIKQNDYAFFANNATIGTDSSVVLPVNLNTFSIGNSSSAVPARPTNGTISAIRYYRKRLPNAKLQALTV